MYNPIQAIVESANHNDLTKAGATTTAIGISTTVVGAGMWAMGNRQYKKDLEARKNNPLVHASVVYAPGEEQHQTPQQQAAAQHEYDITHPSDLRNGPVAEVAADPCEGFRRPAESYGNSVDSQVAAPSASSAGPNTVSAPAAGPVSHGSESVKPDDYPSFRATDTMSVD